MKVLVTGGAGFIGARLVESLKNEGAAIGIIDNLHPQVHGPNANIPTSLANVEFLKSDIRDHQAVEDFVRGFQPTHVVHLAAETGTGQSRDEILRYCQVNIDGTAILIEALAKLKKPPLKFILASSRAVYGEGPWRAADGKTCVAPPRQSENMALARYEPVAEGKALVRGIPVTENCAPSPSSIYASTKLMQEYLVSQSWISPLTLIFRFQNVYGPGQSLRNPYTGVLSIFCGQLLRGEVLNVYEDGEIVRDFVFVDDIVRGIQAGLKESVGAGRIVNLGSAEPITILSAAQRLCQSYGLSASKHVQVTGKFRPGDIRYACANIGLAKNLLNWHPKVAFETGIVKLADWCKRELEGIDTNSPLASP